MFGHVVSFFPKGQNPQLLKAVFILLNCAFEHLISIIRFSSLHRTTHRAKHPPKQTGRFWYFRGLVHRVVDRAVAEVLLTAYTVLFYKPLVTVYVVYHLLSPTPLASEAVPEVFQAYTQT